ncbi:MarR family winged helix-turn-helix transcriptional regulator [Mycolicibacterium fortuitum]|uniref:MarR family transcriptional regulator n=1 Tax=Mycolicibacterium fortuitum TaxID=1766 RepID=A0A1A2CW67_MYCFO|nr:MarR family transcriptional regulator [Mycolicibacterium fortuitum]OBB38657.1 MarR family transcriptional regulator [Mycolicibacterium fortuitum]OBB46713.1 MarR family transcriptional regulator [Mycolicibacterium fortuitum]OBB49683.1 MarR family transcriptional regulator [Mycolicibacterium fortuitum]OBF84315.1 MarR family transcriptional regulator [Mycolicibacterium fortuitum]OBG16728.1 MarR family transcriptional regulator [Mycolicibacterium fortuitum]
MTATESEPLGYLLHRVAAALRPEVAAALTPLGLGLPEFVCLRIISLNPGLTSAELARITNVSAQATNQLLHRLEAAGAVHRPDTAAAGKALPAELTATGRTLLTRAENAVHGADQRVLDRLTPTEQRQLKALLRKAGRDDTACGPGRC